MNRDQAAEVVGALLDFLCERTGLTIEQIATLADVPTWHIAGAANPREVRLVDLLRAVSACGLALEMRVEGEPADRAQMQAAVEDAARRHDEEVEAGLEALYQRHPEARPSVAEVVLALAEQDVSELAERPDLIKRAVASVGPDATVEEAHSAARELLNQTLLRERGLTADRREPLAETDEERLARRRAAARELSGMFTGADWDRDPETPHPLNGGDPDA